jgi:integrase
LLGLRWNDLDLTTGWLTIDHAVVADARTAKRSEPSAPKTRRSNRKLPLPPDVLASLRSLRDQQMAEFDLAQVRTGWLVVDEAGEPYRPEHWSDLWRQHCKAAGVPVVPLHSARHSAVTAMRNAGVPDHLVAAFAGHDEVTMRRSYSHSDQGGLAAGQALSDVLSGTST